MDFIVKSKKEARQMVDMYKNDKQLEDIFLPDIAEIIRSYALLLSNVCYYVHCPMYERYGTSANPNNIIIYKKVYKYNIKEDKFKCVEGHPLEAILDPNK